MPKSYTDAIGDVSEEKGRAAGYADRAVEGAKDYAAEAADRVAAVAKDAYDNPERFVQETKADITRRAQETPLQTLAFAAGIGFVIGALWKR